MESVPGALVDQNIVYYILYLLVKERKRDKIHVAMGQHA
jgi:hypothetical protein